ncbi:asparagine synthase-related protein, partial [Clostridioides difficile]
TDTRIFDIASRIPSEYKVKGKENKIAFRTAASKTLPEEIAFRLFNTNTICCNNISHPFSFWIDYN